MCEMMRHARWYRNAALFIMMCQVVEGLNLQRRRPGLTHRMAPRMATEHGDMSVARRSVLETWTGIGASGVVSATLGPKAAHALGTLPETAPLSRMVAQAVVRVPDTAAAVAFFVNGLFMEVKRQTKAPDGTLTTTVGFGPEELDVPKEFVPGISSFKEYGAHFTLQLVETPDDDKPADGYDAGTSFAYLAMGVPFYRISKLIEAGGEIQSAYGFTVVKAPGGLPCQVVLGDQVRDPFMFAAYRVKDLKASEKYYMETLGMKPSTYPRARPAEVSSFEPPQPPKSSYLSFGNDTFGVLLLPKNSGTWPKGLKPNAIAPGELWGGLHVVDGSGALATPGNRAVAAMLEGSEPDGNGVKFVDYDSYVAEISR